MSGPAPANLGQLVHLATSLRAVLDSAGDTLTADEAIAVARGLSSMLDAWIANLAAQAIPASPELDALLETRGSMRPKTPRRSRGGGS